jgi:hypothetical protein
MRRSARLAAPAPRATFDTAQAVLRVDSSTRHVLPSSHSTVSDSPVSIPAVRRAYSSVMLVNPVVFTRNSSHEVPLILTP